MPMPTTTAWRRVQPRDRATAARVRPRKKNASGLQARVTAASTSASPRRPRCNASSEASAAARPSPYDAVPVIRGPAAHTPKQRAGQAARGPHSRTANAPKHEAATSAPTTVSTVLPTSAARK
jgi:hypothetical protein